MNIKQASGEWLIIDKEAKTESTGILWRGARDAFPNPQALSKLIGKESSIESVSEIASQILLKAPLPNIPSILSNLVCNYHRSNDHIDISGLQNIMETSTKSVCGVVFKKGDIVWTCRQCAKDPTSVQCDKCFRRSDHQGHEVYFHRASGDSGCCDCGDAEAWAKVGNCLDHSHVSNDHCHKDTDPLESVPQDLMKGLRAVLKGVLGVVASFIISTVRGFEKWEMNTFIREQPTAASSPLLCRLHNDDVHSVEQVTLGLMGIGFTRQQAVTLTTQVDKEGEATVAQGSASDAKVLHAYRKLKTELGLIFSMVPEHIVSLEPRVLIAFQWMLSLGSTHDGLRRVIVQEMLAAVTEMSPLSDHKSSSSSANDFGLLDQFPSMLSHLNDPPVPQVSLSHPVFVSSPGASNRVDENAADFESRLIRPFDHCHTNTLALSILASPFLNKSLKRVVVEVVIKFQHDAVFKSCFSQTLTILYPALCLLHCRHIGTVEHSIFHTTVQVYTANSVVALMSSDGVSSRMLPEFGKPIMITKMLLSTFIAVLRDVGCGADNDGTGRSDEFLSHHSIRTHRISQICRDMEYVTSDSFFCARLLRGDVDFGVVADILDIGGLLQCIDSYRRFTTTHVEHETDKWQDAANLVLEFESISTHLVSGALFDPTSAKSDRSSQFSYSKLYDSQVDDDLDAMRQVAVKKCAAQAVKAVGDWCGRHSLEEADSSNYFYSQNATDICMGHSVVFQGIKRFQVSRSPVSVHLPLHRFLSKILTYGAYGNISLYETMELLCSTDMTARVDYVDYPLRCLSFAAQVNVGMWRRNGATAANLAYNYCRAPLSKALRDMDMLAMQMSVYTLSPDSLLALAIDRFELTALLNNYQIFFSPVAGKSEANKEYLGPLLSEFLKTLIHLVTNTPVSLVQSEKDPARPTEGCERALSRELVHHVLGGAQTAGQLQKIKAMIGSAQSVSDSMLSKVVDEMCVRSGGDEGDSRTLSLKPYSYLLYDPEYMNLSNQQASAAADRVRERIKNSLAADSSAAQTTTSADLNQKFVPLLQSQALPVSCDEFASLRCVLYRPLFFSLLHRSLRICLDNAEATGASRLSVVSKVIYLVTLQLHCRDTPLITTHNSPFMSSQAWTSGVNYFLEAFSNSASDGSESHESSSGKQNADTASSLCGAGRPLLTALAEVWTSGLVKDDVLFHQGLGWVLQQIATHSVDGQELLRQSGISFANGANAEESDLAAEKKAKKLQAQQRALQEAQKRAAAFAAMSMDTDEDEEDELGGETEEPEAVSEPECIVCREKKSGSALGSLCFLQPSNLLKNACKQNLDCGDLLRVYRVVAMTGCDVHQSQSVESKVLVRLHQSDHVLVSSRVGAWVHITAPVIGWCRVFDGAYKDSKVSASGDGYSVFLQPVSDLLHNKHGGSRLHVSNCGHTMHFDCWSMFYAANYSRYINGHRSADFLALDIERGEAMCPLCKSVTNTLLPFVNSKKAAGLLQNTSNTSVEASQCGVSNFLSRYSAGPAVSVFRSQLLRNPHSAQLDKNAKGQMFSECVLLMHNLPWANTSRSELAFMQLAKMEGCGGTVVLRVLHLCLSAVAYTLQCATLKLIREKESEVAVVVAGSENKCTLGESDASLLYHLLCTMRMTPSWFEEESEFAQYLSEPLARLIFPEQQTPDSALQLSAGDRLLDALQISGLELERSLCTVPFRAVVTPGYPSSLTLAQMEQLAVTKGVDPDSVHAVFRVPLLAQDLHVISVAVAAGCTDLAEFNVLSTILCLARLTQALLEPLALGLIGDVKSASEPNPHEKATSTEQTAHVHVNPLSPFADNRKRLKVEVFSPDKKGTASISRDSALSPVEALAKSLTALQAAVCEAAGIPARSSGGVNIVSVVLDSWLPFLEFSKHLRDGMAAVSQQVTAADVSPLVGIDGAGSSASQRLKRVEWLLTGLGVDSLKDTLASPPVQQLIQSWSSQLRDHYGADHSSSSGDTSVAVAKLDASIWIPEFAPQSHSAKSSKNPAAKSASTANSNSNGNTAKSATSLPLKLPTMRAAASAAAAISQIGVAAAQNEFDNILAFLSGNDQSNLIASNSPVPPRGDQTPVAASTNIDHMDMYGADYGDFGDEEDEEQDFDYTAFDDTMDEEEEEELEGMAFGEDGDDLPDLIMSGGEDDDEDIDDDAEDELEEEAEIAAAANDLHLPEALNRRLMAQLLAGDINAADIFDQESNELRDEIMDYLRSTGVAGGDDAAAAKKPQPWKLYGVDPVNDLVDECPPEKFNSQSLTCVHTRQPLQGSISGTHAIFGVNGERLAHTFPDLSHFGLGARHVDRVFVDLPPIYTDLYQMTKFPDGPDGVTLEDPAICLVCGRVLNAGNRQEGDRNTANTADKKGECTLHTQQCGVGVGVFFLVQSCNVLLVRGALASYYPSFYLDSSGEVNEHRGQNRPLFLSTKRYKKLEDLYVSHQISKEVARKRSTADSVVRQSWY